MKSLFLLLSVFLLSSCTLKEPERVTTATDRWISIHQLASAEALLAKTKELIDSIGGQSADSANLLVRHIVDALYAEGRMNLAAAIAAHPYGVEVSAEEYSEIAHRLLIQTRLSGTKAPPIDGLDRQEESALLVLFYESNCGSCDQLLEELTTSYDSLQQAGVRIVSIASDLDKTVYEQSSSSFVWRDRLCDYEAFYSPNFKRWGVAATPTLYFVDKGGIVRGVYANLKELDANNRIAKQ